MIKISIANIKINSISTLGSLNIGATFMQNNSASSLKSGKKDEADDKK